MKIFVKENTWLPRTFSDFGWGNGYVVIPKGHELNGKTYGEIHDLIPGLSVNGGLTFSDFRDDLSWKEIPKETEGEWIVGFDTGHYRDTLKKWSKLSVIRETIKLRDQLLNYKTR
tara:strand:- start:1405 stop:1749 length:345 start_codon:yes stop_codon:yes gene_type:complete